MIEVNVAALTALTALLLPGMLERHRGAILNAASTAAFQPGPNQAVYGATKACVLSFTEALAEEVRGSGVRVSCLAPGATDTGPRGAGRHGGHAAVPAGRDRRRPRRPGRARWLAAGQDPDHSRPAKPRPGVLRAPVPARPLSPGCLATCRPRRRPGGSPVTSALRPGPAAANPASTPAHGQPGIPKTARLTPRCVMSPCPGARRTLPPFGTGMVPSVGHAGAAQIGFDLREAGPIADTAV